ncbi:unnamed protein product [Symbiodinium sp. CCMP2592]|nr:unnamed protein product [Symbiodinium sp. CCMP2592]
MTFLACCPVASMARSAAGILEPEPQRKPRPSHHTPSGRLKRTVCCCPWRSARRRHGSRRSTWTAARRSRGCTWPL